MDALLNLMKEKNPELAEYFDLFKQIQQNESSEDDIEDENTLLSLNEEIDKLKQINSKLFSIIKKLKVQLRSEMYWNDELAKAIGACPDCLGKNPSCETCKGLGQPGYYIPDRNLYRYYIHPANESYRKYNSIK